jgi:hypothetical protein
MPLLSTRGAATAKAFNSAQQSNWLAQLVQNFSGDFGRGIVVNPNNQNVIIAGTAFNALTSGYFAGPISVTTTNGINISKKIVGLSGGAFSVVWYSVAVDQNNFNYVSGVTSVYGNDQVFVNRFNSDLSVRSYRTVVGLTGTYTCIGRAVAADNSDNAYVAGNFLNTALNINQALLFKLDVNGAVQWQRTLSGGPFNYELFYSVALDSSNNVYVTGLTYQTATVINGLVAKYNSSGVLQWQISISGATNVFLNDIKVDPSGNIYVAGVAGVGGTAAGLLVKLDNNGTILWQRTLGGSGVTSSYESITIDNLGNIYSNGTTNVNSASTGNDYLLSKYNSSGVIQWQRRLAGASIVRNDTGYAVDVDTNGNYYPIGAMNRLNPVSGTYNDETVFAKLPTNGSLTGTYSLASAPLIYASTSMTEAAGSVSTSVISLTDSVSSLTESTATSIVFYNSGQTYYSTYIP